jgi:class 3 adenylate cyclase
MDVAAWLQGLGLERYVQAFRENDVDAEVLLRLTAEDLRELGVASIGHRRRLLDAVAALTEVAPKSATMPAATVTAAPPDAPTRADAERRQLTVMFCDLVGSTALSTRHDPEDLRELIGDYHRAVAETVGRFDGFVAKYMGDGVLIYFGYPQAHEDDAERAVRAGLAVIEAVGKLPARENLSVRLGIATGLAVVGDLIGEGAAQERGVVGETPNLAARLQGLAGPNTLVIADATRRQVGGLFDLEDLGPQGLAGFAEPQRAWRVLGESGVASRFEALRSGATPLVGRDEELDLLLRRWEQAKMGEGRVVLLSAEPGIGKSRLTEALQERIAEPHRRLRYFCSPHYQDSAFYPIIGQLERAAGFTRDDDAAARRSKLAALFGADGPGDDRLPLLAELLSIPDADGAAASLTPQQKKEKTFEALLRGLEGLAQQPVLMVFEDLHWMDPTSRELLDRTIARIEHLPVLLIATFRPEFQPPWVGQPHVTMLSLSRLGRRAGAALVRELAGNAQGLPDDIIDEILERTDGVPLFLEEVTKVVLEAASGARDAVAAIPGARAPVPATLQASLMARLDRLGPAAREIAQTGAAIGREFSYELVAAVAPRGEAETRTALDHLASAGLVFQRGVPPAAEYQFKHALVQDTAYGTLLRGPRQALHGRIAAAMRRQMPEVVERAPETLAHHLTEAGELSDAAAYWLEAGRRAAARSANNEAAAQLKRGISALRGAPETPERDRLELASQLALGPALLNNRGYDSTEAQEAYRRAGELADLLNDDRARFAANWGLWMTAQATGAKFDVRLMHLGALVDIAERIGDPELTLQAHHSSWATRIWSGEFARCLEHARQGLALYDPDKHRHHALLYGGHDPGVCGTSQNGMALWALGYPDQALRSADESVVLAESLGHLPSELHARWFVATAHFLRGDAVAAAEGGARLLALAREHGLALYQAHGSTIHNWALTRLGRGENPLGELRSSLRLWARTSRVMLDMFAAALAETELRAGNLEQAESALAEAEAVGHGWWQAEILRLRGDLAQTGFGEGTPSPEEFYRNAIAVAQSQQARSFELRAATDLARLWAEQGRPAEARDLLAPVYAWFTEGFDTADLKAAKALLDQLA